MGKKETIKISLSTLFLIISIIVIVIMGYVMYQMNNTIKELSEKVENPKSAPTNNIIEYVWEEYPTNVKEQIASWYFGKVDSDFINHLPEYLPKTLYSLTQKYKEFDDEFPFAQLFENYLVNDGGDSTQIIATESNYSQFSSNNFDKNANIKKYSEKIEYKIAILNSIYLELGSNANEKEQNIEKRVALQEKDLKSGKKDFHYANSIPSDRKFYYEIPKMLVMNGNNISEEVYKNNARAKKIKVIINNDKEYTFELKDTNAVQVFDIDYKQDNISKPVNIEVEVLETYSGEKTEDIFISDIQFSINSNIPQGR